MKRITFLMAALLIFASSCINTTDQTLKVDIVEYEAQTPLFEDAPYTFSIDMKIEWPVSGPDAESLKDMQKGITGLLFGNEIQTFDIEYAIDAYNRSAVEFYQLENEEIAQEIDDDWGFMLNWSESMDGNFLPTYAGYISYVKYLYGYSGGAHGMDAKTAVTFDSKTGKTITENDLFVPGYEERLTESLRNHLSDCNIEKDMLFEPEIFPSENFYLTPEGITYIYQRYEIGPYAIGIIEVTVPWSEIQDILR